MPTKWTAELDAILLHGVFEECNISFSKALCAKIAERVQDTGIDCTPKAVENRLYSWKKKNISGNTNMNSATSTPAMNSPAVKKTPKTPRLATPKAKSAKKALQFEDDNDGPEGLVVDNEALLSPTPTLRKRKAGKMSYAESQSEAENETLEDEYMPKKIKTEDAEDAENGEMDGEVV